MKKREVMPKVFVFDIHGVLVRRETAKQFLHFLKQKAERDQRIDLAWAGNVPALMNGLLYKHCPVCSFERCQYAGASEKVSHLATEVCAGALSFEEMKVGITKMLTHLVECAPSVRIILDYYAEFITQPAQLVATTQTIPLGEQLLQHLHKSYGPESLFLLSNASTQLYKGYLTRFPHIFDTVPQEHVVLSSEVGSTKPGKDVFKLLLDRYNYQPEECFLIDDMQSNIEMAQLLGMQSVLFSEAETEEMKLFFARIGFTHKKEEESSPHAEQQKGNVYE